MEVITFEGVRELWEKKRKGEELPENWKELLLKYITHKEKILKKWKKKFGVMSEIFEENYQLYMHACLIAKRLGVTWPMKKREEI